MCADEELTSVTPGVVAVASVDQHVGEGGVLGQGAHPGCPFGRFGVGVPVAEPLCDVAAVPLAGVPVHAARQRPLRGH